MFSNKDSCVFLILIEISFHLNTIRINGIKNTHKIVNTTNNYVCNLIFKNKQKKVFNYITISILFINLVAYIPSTCSMHPHLDPFIQFLNNIDFIYLFPSKI